MRAESETSRSIPDTATNAAIQLAQAGGAQSPAGKGATEAKGETVEQRIKDLHVALKITADEETKWNEVAQDMRENAAAMDKLIAATRTTPPQTMSAADDLKTYQKIAQACRRAEEPNFIVREAVRGDARCSEEDRRRSVQVFPVVRPPHRSASMASNRGPRPSHHAHQRRSP